MTTNLDLGWVAAAAYPDAKRLAEYVDVLRELVDIDTPSSDVAALQNAYAVMQRELERRGLSVRTVPGDNDVQVLVAEHDGDTQGLRCGFLAHIDTVFGPQETQSRPFRIDGNRATGPGVADMKGGLVSILWIIDLLDEHDALPGLRVVVNGDEEVGSATSRDVLRREMNDRHLVLVFEPGRPSGAFVTHRRGTIRARLVVEGVAAHSGVAPRSGANAIHDLARRIGDIAELGERYPNCDINVTRVRGGDRVNIIPDRASCDLDARTSTVGDDQALRDDLMSIATVTGVSGTSASLEWHASRPPLGPSDAQGPLLEAFRAAAAAGNLDFDTVGTGGGSDANLLGGIDAVILDGCGPVGDNYHRADEYVEVATIPSRAALVAAGLSAYMHQWAADA